MSTSDFCFVIMPFREELRSVYNGAIKPAVESQNILCKRADEIEGSGNIVREIVECIVDAKLIIADLTDQRPNVFYELGIAHALYNKTIIITQNIEDVPFDVKAYKVFPYSDTIDGGIKLRNEIESAINKFDTWSKRPTNPVADFLPKNQEKIPLHQYVKLEEDFKSVEKQLKEAQDFIKKTEKKRQDHDKLLESNDNLSHTLKTYRGLLEQLFKNAIPGQEDKADFVEVMNNIIDQVKKGEDVSVPVGEASENKNPKNKETKKGRITFRKL